MKSWKTPTGEIIEKALSSVKKETDRQYFFSKLKNPLWINPLVERGFFKHPPGINHLPDDRVQFPFWPEFIYLKNVSQDAPDQVIQIILSIPKTENERIYDGIVEIALGLKGEFSKKLLPKILEYFELKHLFLAYRFHDLLVHWITEDQIDAALEITKNLIPFQSDPRFRQKQHQRRENSENSFRTILKPTPRFDEWVYQQVLEKGVRLLVEKKPYQVACILIDATARMIQLSTHIDDLENGNDEDFSEIWCRHLNRPDQDHQESKESLVLTLTFACEKVYEINPELIETLDQVLRKQQWKVFKRLRQHLYALNPSNQTLPWIREFILEYKDYDKWDYHYEFQLMIRKACEHFGTYLLSKVERTEIFSAIRSGPPKEDFREWMGANFTEEKFQQRQRNFHRKQLHPFKNLLSGEYQSYFNELENEFKDKPVSDEDYAPMSESRSGYVSYRSPLPPEELTKLTDEQLLDYINDWQEIHRDKDDWLTEINIEALAETFQSVFKNTIIVNEDRLSFWIKNYKHIERPIYIRFLIKAMQDLAREHRFEKLEQWIGVCNWVLSHPDIDNREELRRSDELKENPDWRSSRRAVIDLIDTCLNKDINTPVNARDSLAKLLRLLCTQFDWRLDRNKPVILNHDNSLIEALNNNRSLALEKLVNFGFWVRRHFPDDQVPEVTEILEERFKPDTKFPLTKPEFAILGMNYARVFNLNHNWAIRHKTNFFPQKNIASWLEAFGNYLRFNRPVKEIFVAQREDFVFALEHLDELEITKSLETKVVDNLGQHLFTYYLWEVFPLKGEESLLERYYEKTATNHQCWINLFNHVGHSLNNSGKFLETDLVERITAFFNWRFEVNEPEELQKFTYWLAAECLDPDWRLNTYLKILDAGKTKNNVYLSIELEVLNKMLASHTTQVIECFAKLTDLIDQNNSLYIQVEEAEPILKAGLNSEDPHVQKNAERARENLLRVGRFDFLDIS